MKKNYRITDICPACALKLESALKKIEGINDAKVSVMAERLSIDLDEKQIDKIEKNIKKTCKKVEPDCVLSTEL